MSKHPATQVSAGCEPQGPLNIKAILALLFFLFSFALAPLAANAAKKFDHDNTGFVLNGAHQKVTCETCHVRGVFKGTPKTCDGCHAKVTQIVADKKSSGHMKSSDRCDDCHSEKAWRPAKMDHTSTTAQCSDCHTAAARIATSKPSNHTTKVGNYPDKCDDCHKTTTWVFNHAMVPTSYRCDSCHYVDKPSNATHSNIGTTDCSNCHHSFTSFSSNGRPDHSSPTLGQCITCHVAGNSMGATFKDNAHISSSNNCDACHDKLAASWTPVAANKVDHSQVQGTCSSCHEKIRPTSKADGTPHPATGDCGGCHYPGPSLWKPAINGGKPDHSTFSGNCATCHVAGNTQGATYKDASVHIASTNACDACHDKLAASWTPVAANKVDHSQVQGTCSSCHEKIRPATKADGTPHPATGDCGSCHYPGPALWKPAINGGKPDHSTFSGNCATCHVAGNTQGATYKDASVHIASTNACDACHDKLAASWTPVAANKVDHSQVQGTCSSCHEKDRPLKKADGTPHVTTGDCGGCHNPGPALWKPAKVSGAKPSDHNTYTSGCSNCHGSSAPGKGTGHIPSGTNCEACHDPSLSVWKPTKFDHSMTTLACISCHLSSTVTDIAQVNMTKHMPLSSNDNCGVCHNTGPAGGSWTPRKSPTVPHSGYIVATCTTCHTSTNPYNISGIEYKGINHIGSTNTCDGCHNLGPSPWKPVKDPIDHTQLSGSPSCASCHDSGKTYNKWPTNHFTGYVAQDCGTTCHTSTSSWSPGKFDHNANSVGLNSGTCANCHATGKNYIGVVTMSASGHFSYTKAPSLKCDQCHNSTAKFDPGYDYTHLAVDNVPVTGHGVTLNNCAYCHSKNNDTAYYKSTAYVYSGASTGTCGGCHGAQFTSNLSKHQSARTSSDCKITKPAPADIGHYTDCSQCHPRAGSSWDDNKSCIP